MPGFKVTPQAYDDLKAIAHYTEHHWGRIQRNAYLKAFEKRFRWLAENPAFGKDRSDIEIGYYSYPQGQHVIFYIIGQEGIEIIGIPHKEMDTYSFFPHPR